MNVWHEVKVKGKGLRERLGLDDIISVLQQDRLRQYGNSRLCSAQMHDS